MGTWIEIRCEDRSHGKTWDEITGSYLRCYSDDNEGPHGMALDSIASVSKTLRILAGWATKQGWKKTRDGWVCPYCVKARSQLQSAKPNEPETAEGKNND